MKSNFLLISILFCFLASASAQSATNEEQLLMKLSNDWMTATMNRDENSLNKILAPEFTLGGCYLEESPISRSVWMENTMENMQIDSVNYIQMRMNVIDNVAIVQSYFYWSVTFKDGPVMEDTVSLIDTWMKREQGWQVVSRLGCD